MIKNKLYLFLLLHFICYYSCKAKSLDGKGIDASTFQTSSYAFSDGDYAKGFVWLNGGFSVPANGTITINLPTPISGPINLNDSGKVTLDGNLTLGPNVTIQKGGVINARSSTIYLNADLTIPAGTFIEFTSDTVIDGIGHDIIFEDGTNGGYFKINGAAGTTLTVRNCHIRGLKNYDGGYGSFVFGTSPDQKLVLNEVVVHMSGNYNFSGGALDIKNSVSLIGTKYYFADNSEYEITIKKDSEFFIDTRTIFTYDPKIKQKHPTKGMLAKLIVMEDVSSRLFLNGCTLYLPLTEGLVLTNGHLIIDHKTIVYGNGAICGNYSFGLAVGNSKALNDLTIDIMPGADFQVNEATLHINNSN